VVASQRATRLDVRAAAGGGGGEEVSGLVSVLGCGGGCGATWRNAGNLALTNLQYSINNTHQQ